MASNDSLLPPPPPEPPSDASSAGKDPGGVAGMTRERFERLWQHEVPEGARTWTPDMTTYRDALMYLMGMRAPHYAVLALPTHLQPVMIALFLKGHQIYVAPTESGTRIRMTLWRPPYAEERGESAGLRDDEQGEQADGLD